MTPLRQSIHDVVDTGLGATTPSGGDVPSMWAAVLAGESGVSLLDPAGTADLPVKVAATVAKQPTTTLGRPGGQDA